MGGGGLSSSAVRFSAAQHTYAQVLARQRTERRERLGQGLGAKRHVALTAGIDGEFEAFASAEVTGPHRRASAVTSLTPSRTEGGKGTYG